MFRFGPDVIYKFPVTSYTPNLSPPAAQRNPKIPPAQYHTTP